MIQFITASRNSLVKKFLMKEININVKNVKSQLERRNNLQFIALQMSYQFVWSDFQWWEGTVSWFLVNSNVCVGAHLPCVGEIERFWNGKSKLSYDVRYPNTLKINRYCSDSQIPHEYELYAILVHSGFSVNSGHYYSYCKTSRGGWSK